MDVQLDLQSLPAIVRVDVSTIQDDSCDCPLCEFGEKLGEPMPLTYQKITILFADATSISFNHFVDDHTDEEPVFMSQPLLPHSVDCTAFKPSKGLLAQANEIYQKEIGKNDQN